MIAENQKSKLWDTALIPTDQVDLRCQTSRLRDAMAGSDAKPARAAAIRPGARDQLVDQKLYRDQTKPEIDLVGSYGVTAMPARK